MPFFRQRLVWVLGCWLAFQFAGVVAPLALAASADGSVEEICMCPGGGHGATCPMHHGDRQAGSADRDDDPRRCVMRSAAATHDLALLSLSVGGGLLPHAVTMSGPSTRLGSIAPPDVSLPSRVPLPVAPPPRA